jgi:hypothetical protein
LESLNHYPELALLTLIPAFLILFSSNVCGKKFAKEWRIAAIVLRSA